MYFIDLSEFLFNSIISKTLQPIKQQDSRLFNINNKIITICQNSSSIV